MISDKTVEFHRRAAMAMDSFTASDQRRVKRSVSRLLTDPEGSHARVRRISAGEPLYLMRVSPDIRAIFRKASGGIVVEDVVRRETLNSFAEKDHAAASILRHRRLRKKKPTRHGFRKAAGPEPTDER